MWCRLLYWVLRCRVETQCHTAPDARNKTDKKLVKEGQAQKQKQTGKETKKEGETEISFPTA